MDNKCSLRKILIVEDNAVNLELFLDILETGGYLCFGAMNGRDAILVARKEMPDLILLDIQLPEMDGYTVMEHLRAIPETHDITTVALSGHVVNGNREKSTNRKFDGYIAKPVTAQHLLKMVGGYMQFDGR